MEAEGVIRCLMATNHPAIRHRCRDNFMSSCGFVEAADYAFALRAAPTILISTTAGIV